MARQDQVGAHKTSIRSENSDTVVRYHATDIVKFNHKTVSLDTGGWYTATTKTRMNQASNQYGLGYRVFQRNHAWYVEIPDGDTIDFTDKITFNRCKGV